jgi:hypothetical protein
MNWFSNLFKPFQPPTASQRRFAEALGITVTARMSKDDVSRVIDEKKAAEPKAFGKASGMIRKGRERASALINSDSPEVNEESGAAWLKTPEGKALAKELKKWERITKSEPYGILVYRHHQTRKVEIDVARIAGVNCNHNAQSQVQLFLDVALPQTVRDACGFTVLEWSKHLGWFPMVDVLLWQKLPESFADVDGCIVGRDADGENRRQLKRYEDAIEKGRRMMKENGMG